jgi:hypothetical protein
MGTDLDHQGGMTTSVLTLPDPFLPTLDALAAKLPDEPAPAPCRFLGCSGLETVHDKRVWPGTTSTVEIVIDGETYLQLEGTAAHCHPISDGHALRYVVQWRLVQTPAVRDLEQLIARAGEDPLDAA